MEDPRAITPRSIMPSYAGMLTRDLDYAGIQKRVEVMAMLGVPYRDLVQGGAEQAAREQAQALALSITEQGYPADLSQKEIIAMVAYLQRLGVDIRRTDAQAMAGGR
jgi:cytochrome c oxidase cbb3-type subunit I/II